MCTGRGSNQGSLGPKSDTLTTAPLRRLKYRLVFSFAITGFHWLLDVPDTVNDNLQCSVRCYSEALKLIPDTKEDNFTGLSKRLGNAYNELGVCQMQQALELTQNEGIDDSYLFK